MSIIANIDYQARVFVGGLPPSGGQWHQRFASLGLVQLAERDGWGAELRQAVTRTVKLMLLNREPMPSPERALPTDQKWIDAQRLKAARFLLAKEWRDSVMAPGEEFDDHIRRMRRGANRREAWKPASKPAFDVLRQISQNRMHIDDRAELERIKNAGLTERSKRMQGDDA